MKLVRHVLLRKHNCKKIFKYFPFYVDALTIFIRVQSRTLNFKSRLSHNFGDRDSNPGLQVEKCDGFLCADSRVIRLVSEADIDPTSRVKLVRHVLLRKHNCKKIFKYFPFYVDALTIFIRVQSRTLNFKSRLSHNFGDRDSNPGLQFEKCDGFLCAMPPSN